MLTAKLADLQQYLQRLQLGSVFDVALSTAEVSEDVISFIEFGGLDELYVSYRRFRKQRSGSLSLEVLQKICGLAMDIYQTEWRNLTDKSTLFRHLLNRFPLEYVTEFNMELLY